VSDHTIRIAAYRSIIKNEAERWLISGRPIPLFLFFEVGVVIPADMKPYADRNLAPPDSQDALFAMDFLLARTALDEQLAEAGETLREGPAKRFAPVLFHAGNAPQLIRIDLTGRSNLEAIDALKISELCGVLDAYALTAISNGRQRDVLLESFTSGLEHFLTILLQRPPTQVEVEEVLSTLK